MSMSRMSQQQVILRMAQALTCKRTISGSAIRAGIVDSKSEVAPVYRRIKDLQKKFQVDDGVPVHLKGGPMDKVLYYITIGLIAVGLAGCVEYFYTSAFPKKQ